MVGELPLLEEGGTEGCWELEWCVAPGFHSREVEPDVETDA